MEQGNFHDVIFLVVAFTHRQSVVRYVVDLQVPRDCSFWNSNKLDKKEKPMLEYLRIQSFVTRSIKEYSLFNNTLHLK